MVNMSREALESLLRHRKLDHTLTSGSAVVPNRDARVQGDLPRGQISEFVGPRSSGRLALAVSALAAATARGESVALVDPLDMFDPQSARASGIAFERMLWIRGEATSSARTSLSCEYGTLQKSLDRGVKALNLVLQAGGFGLVVFDLAPLMEMAPQAIARLPHATWLRLHRVIEGSQTACVLIGAAHIARSAGGVTVQLGQGSGLRAQGSGGDYVCVPLSAAAS